jgi:hypothetical protein
MNMPKVTYTCGRALKNEITFSWGGGIAAYDCLLEQSGE